MTAHTVDLIVIGSEGAGKTVLISQFCHGIFVEAYDPTIEDGFAKDLLFGGMPLHVKITDTAGSESLWKESWTQSGSAYMLVYNSHSRNSLALATHRATEIRFKEKVGLQGKAPILIVANEIDPKGDYQTKRDLVANAKQFAKQTDCIFMEVCAKNAVDVKKAFTTIISETLPIMVKPTVAPTQAYSFLKGLRHAFSCLRTNK